MKRALLLILVFLPMLASADKVEINGIYYNLDSEAKTAEVTSNPNKYDGDVVIPSSVNHEGVDYSVTGIGVRAFYNSSDLTSVSIPNSMTTIGRDAFRGCSNLTKVEINNNAIVSKDNPSSSPTPITSFFGTQVEEYVLGEDVTSIGSYAFYNCNNLTSVQMSNSITTIGEGAFQFCYNLASVKMSGHVTNIGQFAFNNCFNLASITIPSGVTKIELWTFSGCGLTKVEIHSDAIVSRDYNYRGLSSDFGGQVKEYILGEEITGIGNYAFYSCAISSITIPDKVTRIGESAFAECHDLNSIFIPKNVTSIGENAFYNCNGLTSIQVESGNTAYDSRENCNALINTADNTMILGCQNTVIPNSVTAIGDNAFYGCTDLTSVSIPNGVTSIGYSVFCGCSGLTSISIPNSVTSIGQYAFSHCTGLTSISIPNSVTSIGQYAFFHCTGLTSIAIPNSVTTIDEYAFFFCSGFSSIIIPSSVTTIGNRAFDGCSGLTAIQVENGNTVYDSRDNCNAIIETASNTLLYGCQNTVIPNSVTAIGDDAFYECSGLTAISIPNGVTSIGRCAFTQCFELTSITIPNSVTSIGYCAFTDCRKLATVIIGNGVTNIDDGAFIRCSGLKNMYCYTEQVPELGNNVFDYSHYNATLHVPEGSLEAYNTTEQWMDFGIIVALADSDPIPTGIKGINDVMTGESYYSIDGKQMATPQRGLNIIRMNDGTTKKIVIK